MAAPIKNNTQQTGSLKGLLFIVSALMIIGGVLIYASSLPSLKSASKPNIDQPQVAGKNITEEYVAPEDIAEPLAATKDSDQDYYLVSSVVDGDTIKVNIAGKTETVRLIGVDTPETKDPRKPVQCYGLEASNYTKKLLLNKQVKLVTDDSQQNRDKYGRLLRYVYLSDDLLFNLLLVSAGYAYEYTYKTPYKFQTEFIAAANEAQLNLTGLWNPNTCNGKK